MNAELTRNFAVGKGRIEFTVSNYFPVPVAKLWDAITVARQLQPFFFDKVEGDFTRDLTPVFFTWKECGRYAAWPTVFQEGKKLEFRWANGDYRYLTTVTMTLKKKAHYVELEIHERGWKPADLDSAFGNCNGWTMFLDYLKGYLLHGVHLRTEKLGTTVRRVAA